MDGGLPTEIIKVVFSDPTATSVTLAIMAATALLAGRKIYNVLRVNSNSVELEVEE